MALETLEDEETKLPEQTALESGGQEADADADNFEISVKEETNASDTESFETTEDPENFSECASSENFATDAHELPDNCSGTAELEEKILTMAEELKRNTEAQRDLERKVIQTLKENASFQRQVRVNMKNELDENKQKLNGAIFIPLLKEIAELYIEWQDILDDLEEGAAKDKAKAIFNSLRDMLEENKCKFGKSDIGASFSPKHSKIQQRIPTGKKEQHITVAKSYNEWIEKEPFMLYNEKVDVYVYDENKDLAPTSDQPESILQVDLQEE